MSELEREEIKRTIRGLTEEEKVIVAKGLPNKILLEELDRRLATMTDRFTQVREILKLQEGE